MRSLVITENITVDGAIAGRGHQIPDLKLLDAKTFRNEVIYASYAPV
ncbi:hypothetical protein [Nocardia cyriacigeorgica]|nr:hypothetical protein [Nocardia cyriacigeorgica]MBF6453618.1 hypothetical protein [Nocardia cyriacigeorgica]MBF6481049.1 hypothetical protein [Nocardia cyriacigeorgica]MBF6550786.1 hypothetical protein [Nocardia cyriacigeorgica]